MSEKLRPFDARKLGERTPFPSVRQAIEEIRSFPPGICTEEELDLIATTVANLEEIHAMARRKGIELGFPVKKRGWLDRFRTRSTSSQSRDQEIKYKGLSVRLLTGEETSVTSGTQCKITRAELDPDKTYIQQGDSYPLPNDHTSERGSDFIACGSRIGYSSHLFHETMVQLKESKGLPIFVVNVENNWGGKEAVGVYTIEPSADEKLYHVRFIFPEVNYLLEIRSTDKKGLFEVRELTEVDSS